MKLCDSSEKYFPENDTTYQNTFVHDGLDEDTKKSIPLPPNRAERSEDGHIPPVGTGVETSANRSLVTSMQMINVLLQRVVKGEVSVIESTFDISIYFFLSLSIFLCPSFALAKASPHK